MPSGFSIKEWLTSTNHKRIGILYIVTAVIFLIIAGSLGMLPSASIGPVRSDGKQHALYEPIHGSAPDIAGKGIANPLGAILSFALCMRYTLKQPQEAERLERAVEIAIAKGARTADIAAAGMRAMSTREMGDAVCAELVGISR